MGGDLFAAQIADPISLRLRRRHGGEQFIAGQGAPLEQDDAGLDDIVLIAIPPGRDLFGHEVFQFGRENDAIHD